jgi:hypothetical protein
MRVSKKLYFYALFANGGEVQGEEKCNWYSASINNLRRDGR